MLEQKDTVNCKCLLKEWEDSNPNDSELYTSAINFYFFTGKQPAVANMLTGNYDTAISYLKRAETINPRDFIVLNNLAHGYKLKGDKVNAIKYYELTEKYRDEEAKEAARKNIRELQEPSGSIH